MSTLHDLEAALGRAAERPRFLAAAGVDDTVDPPRQAANFAAVEAELDAPRPGRLARVLARLGVDDLTIPLITATPALRRSWVASVVVALVFALNAANTSTADGVDRIIVFLTIAPLVPLVGVALAFGRAVDPTHDVAVAAPLDGFRLFLVRAITVVAASTGVLLLASVLVPEGGASRIAWLLPSLAVTAATMALATRLDPRVAAGVVASAWITMVVVISQAAGPATAFGPGVQVVSLLITVAGVVAFSAGRRRLDTITNEHP
jgi:hypothetical protein